jgi:hypothetical protein
VTSGVGAFETTPTTKLKFPELAFGATPFEQLKVRFNPVVTSPAAGVPLNAPPVDTVSHAGLLPLVRSQVNVAGLPVAASCAE